MNREHDGTLWRGKFYRGEWKRGGQWTDQAAEDLTVAIGYLDSGRRLAGRLLALADNATVRGLAITTNVELARAIVWKDDAEKVPQGLQPPDPKTPYDTKWPAVARVAWLMRAVDRLDTAAPREHAARALYTLATHLRQVDEPVIAAVPIAGDPCRLHEFRGHAGHEPRDRPTV